MYELLLFLGWGRAGAFYIIGKSFKDGTV